MAVKFFDQAALKYLLNKLKNTFVRQEEGKGLSSNDFTDTLKNKLETLDGEPEYSAMTGATAEAAGTTGLVPAPEAGKQDSFLKGDGTWATPTDTTYDAISESEIDTAFTEVFEATA